MHTEYETLEKMLSEQEEDKPYLCKRYYPSIADFVIGCQALDIMLLG